MNCRQAENWPCAIKTWPTNSNFHKEHRNRDYEMSREKWQRHSVPGERAECILSYESDEEREKRMWKIAGEDRGGLKKRPLILVGKSAIFIVLHLVLHLELHSALRFQSYNQSTTLGQLLVRSERLNDAQIASMRNCLRGSRANKRPT